MANERNGTIYVGSTDDISRRAWEHREGVYPGSTARHGCTMLVWYEAHDSREGAFQREHRIKEWRRTWKLMLIEEANPDWVDLYETLNQ